MDELRVARHISGDEAEVDDVLAECGEMEFNEICCLST